MMTVIKESGKYTPVMPELGMNISYVIVLIAVDAVVVIVPALVGTEFLVGPAKEPGSAVKTYSFHNSNVFLKLRNFNKVFPHIALILTCKTVYKRI